jgi:4-azaleucine resistance transporter AzlC
MQQNEIASGPPVTDLDSAAFDRAGVIEGARRSVPVALGIFAYGLVFGVLAQQAHLSVLESLLMSGIVFAGSSQFAALGLWVAPLPVAAIVLTTLVINLRHILMGAALTSRMAYLKGWQKYLSLFVMTDESWALTMGYFAKGGRNSAFLLGSGLMAFIAWTGATFVGETAGSVLQDPRAIGLDFAFSAVFIGLLLGFWKGRRDLLPWGVAAVVAIFAALWLPGKWYIILGGIAGSVVGAVSNDS